MKQTCPIGGWVPLGLVCWMVVGGVPAQAASNAVPEVAGYCSMTLAGGPNFISVPLHRRAAYRGLMQSATANTVSFGGATGWQNDQLAPREGLTQFILVVKRDVSTSPGIEGDWWPIIGNSSNAVSLDPRSDNLATHLGSGDELEIRRLTSIKDVFGYGTNCVLNKDADFDITAGEEDVIRMVAGSSITDVIFYHDGSLALEGYYLNGFLVGFGDGSTLTLEPNQPLMLFRKTGSASVTFPLAGMVQTTRLTHYLASGANAVGAVFPVPAPIATSNLKESGWASDLNFDLLTAEEGIIRAVVGTSFGEEVFHYAGIASTNGWYAHGALNEAWGFQPMRGWLLFVSGPAPLVWRQTVPFDPAAGLDIFP